jgi:hypothetical protein
MHYACWIPNSTNKHSEYSTHIACQYQKPKGERNLTLRLYANCQFFIALIEIWTKTPLSFTHVCSWNISFRTNVCLGKPNLEPWISRTNKAVKLQCIKFKEFHSFERGTAFLFLQYTGPRICYALNHSSNFLENTLTCVVFEYGSPEEYTISKSKEADVISWVPNFHCLFTGILSR